MNTQTFLLACIVVGVSFYVVVDLYLFDIWCMNLHVHLCTQNLWFVKFINVKSLLFCLCSVEEAQVFCIVWELAHSFHLVNFGAHWFVGWTIYQLNIYKYSPKQMNESNTLSIKKKKRIPTSIFLSAVSD